MVIMSWEEGMINQMWIDVWGNSLIGAIVLFGVFAYFCYRSKYDVAKSSSVMIPVLFGIVTNGSLPMWVEGMFLVGIGTLWGLMILRVTGIR